MAEFIAKDTDSDEIVVLEHQGTESTGRDRGSAARDPAGRV